MNYNSSSHLWIQNLLVWHTCSLVNVLIVSYLFQMSSMSCYTLAEGGSIFPSGDELGGNQKTEQGNYWTQWNSRLSDDLNTTSLYSDEHENGIEQCFDDADEHERSSQQERSSACARVSSGCSTGPSEEQSEGPAPLELQHSKETNDIFLYVHNTSAVLY